MQFEPTSDMIHNALSAIGLIGNKRFGTVEIMQFKCVIEAGQKELVRHLLKCKAKESCFHTFNSNTVEDCILIKVKDWQAVLEHFDLE